MARGAIREQEFEAFKAAAMATNPKPIEALDYIDYCDHHLHVAW
jgi:hypothetical protein